MKLTGEGSTTLISLESRQNMPLNIMISRMC